MKRILSLFIALIMGCSVFAAALSAYGDVFTEDGFICNFYTEDTIFIRGYNGNKTKKLTIPATIKGYPVRSVSLKDDTEEETYNGIEEIVISEGVAEISKYAFEDMDGLKSVTIPDSVKLIGDYSFAYCGSLEKISIGNGVERIGESAFWQSMFLNKRIDRGTVYINKYLIAVDFDATGTIKVKDGTVLAAVDAFEFHDYVEKVVIPDSMTTIPTFRKCYALKSITLPSTLTVLPKECFFKCTSLESITVPNGVKYISRSCFALCSKLKTVNLPVSVRKIYMYAFRGCKSLSSIKLPKKLTLISKYAFRNTGLQTLFIPKSVKTIKYAAFVYCKKLKTIKVSSKNKNFYIKKGGLYRSKDDTLIWKN